MLSLLLVTLARAADGDGDGVANPYDRCKWLDDTVDLDGNYVPDCAETLLPEFGFRSASTTQTGYDPYWPGQTLSWSSADLAGYSYASGAGLVGSGTTYAMLAVDACIPVTYGVTYAVMGQFSTSVVAVASAHDLIVEEYADDACATPSTYDYPAWGTRPAGQAVLDLVGAYTADDAAVLAVRLYATADSTVAMTGVFDNLSMHAVTDVDPGDPSTH